LLQSQDQSLLITGAEGATDMEAFQRVIADLQLGRAIAIHLGKQIRQSPIVDEQFAFGPALRDFYVGRTHWIDVSGLIEHELFSRGERRGLWCAIRQLSGDGELALEQNHGCCGVVYPHLEHGSHGGYRSVSCMHNEWPHRIAMHLKLGLPMQQVYAAGLRTVALDDFSIGIQCDGRTIRQMHGTLFTGYRGCRRCRVGLQVEQTNVA
jgi:hypothetical protein